ncbi:MAG: adenylate/guanylate cyclase domain-containing protein [Desulfamplus sp.]|nr:adenylate/guanylate cyclase domain-containing protein [Desulfamplus sp.]
MNFRLKNKKYLTMPILRNKKQRNAIGLVFTALMVGIFIIFNVFMNNTGGSCSYFDFKVLDIFYKFAVRYGFGPEASFSPGIVYLNITDETYNFFDKNYLDRKDMATLNNALEQMDTEAVIYDIIFARRSSEDSDREFSQSIESLGNVYMPTALVLSDKPYKFKWKDDVAHERLRYDYLGNPNEIEINSKTWFSLLLGDSKNSPKPFYAVKALTQNSSFAISAKGSGDISAKADADGIYRHITMLVKIDDKYLPTLSLAVFLDWAGISLDDVKVEWGKKITIPAAKDNQLSEGNLLNKDVIIPIDNQGRTFIPFVNVIGKDFNYMSVNKFLTNFQDEDLRGNLLELFEGKFIFIADIAIGTSDLGYTPLQNDAPLVVTHASLLNAMLTNTFYVEWELGKTILLICLLMIFMATISLLRSSWLLYISGALVVIAIPLFTWFEFISFSLFPVVTVMSTLLVLFLALITTLEASGSKERAFIRNTFARYVPEKVVHTLLAQPEMVSLSGEERVVTVLFSDIADFTTISESLSPGELVHLLNEYFTEMSDIIMNNGGIIDKFQGDSIMAEFGVPIPMNDHADKAVTAALEMLERLSELREIWKNKGQQHLIYCRIGINTNNMIVGNIGSKKVFDYTVIGDAVNLASRLEGANKHYGTSLMISEFTHAQLTQGRFKTRILDYVKVKGKSEPVRVYEVYARVVGNTQNCENRSSEDNYYITYHKGFEAYLNQRFSKAIELFSLSLSLKPNDKASIIMLERINNLLNSKLLQNGWNGSVSL